jgi:hypothetical protein
MTLSDNAIGASETSYPSVQPSEEKTLIFTWSEPFQETVTRTEIIPRFNPFAQTLR